MLKYTEQIPSSEEYNQLRNQLTLIPFEKKAVINGLHNSIKCVSVYDNDKLIGFGRIVGDNGMVYIISNIFVLPDYQKQGIGFNIMKLLMQYLDTVCMKNTIVILMARKGTEGFYKKFGFISRPTQELGSGMCKYY